MWTDLHSAMGFGSFFELIVELLEYERGFGCGMRFGKRKYANAADEFKR